MRSILRRKQQFSRGIFNPATISRVLILCFITNQSVTIIMSAGRSLTSSSSDSQQVSRGSLVDMVAASPSPEPAAAVARSSGSANHRVPPMNGSIFGKRSLNGNLRTSQSNGDKAMPYAASSVQRQSVDQSSGTINESGLSAQKFQGQQQASTRSLPYSQLQTSTSEPTNYKDIITETIENFLTLNNESKFAALTYNCHRQEQLARTA